METDTKSETLWEEAFKREDADKIAQRFLSHLWLS